MKANVDEFVNDVFVTFDPDAAAKRFQQHIINWAEDLRVRHAFYDSVIEAVLPTLPDEDADRLRRIWAGMWERGKTATTEEAAVIDEWLVPLSNEKPAPGCPGWYEVLSECEGGYYTPQIDTEMGELVKVPGFQEAFDRLGGPDENH